MCASVRPERVAQSMCAALVGEGASVRALVSTVVERLGPAPADFRVFSAGRLQKRIGTIVVAQIPDKAHRRVGRNHDRIPVVQKRVHVGHKCKRRIGGSVVDVRIRFVQRLTGLEAAGIPHNRHLVRTFRGEQGPALAPETVFVVNDPASNYTNPIK